MRPRHLLAAAGLMLAGGAAHAQYVPATYQQPYCREFNQVVTVGGQLQPGYGRACYQPDGSWQIVSDAIPAAQPVQYVPAQNQVIYVPQATRTSVFSVNFGSWGYPRYTNYYHQYGHGWRDWDRGRNWNNNNRGHGNHDRRGDRGRGHGRH